MARPASSPEAVLELIQSRRGAGALLHLPLFSFKKRHDERR
jgi:hypothetical protein